MARSNKIQLFRGTKANLDSLAGSNGLFVGEPYFITDQGGRIAIATSTNSYVMAQQRGVSGYAPGIPEANEIVMSATAPYPFSLTQANCSVTSEVAATASCALLIKNNGSNIGTATFAASGTTATISISTPGVSLGNKLTLVMPGTADATLSGLTIMLRE